MEKLGYVLVVPKQAGPPAAFIQAVRENGQMHYRTNFVGHWTHPIVEHHKTLLRAVQSVRTELGALQKDKKVNLYWINLACCENLCCCPGLGVSL